MRRYSMQENNQRIIKLVFTGLMAALVFVFSFLSFPIPNPLLDTRIHLGNVMCLLSGLLLGGLYGGAAAGIGSFLFDLFNPLYIASAPFTLVFKFMMGFLCGIISHAGGRKSEKLGFNILGGIAGSVAYMVLHLGKVFLTGIWFQKIAVEVALVETGSSALISLVNAILAVLLSIPLCYLVKKGLKAANIELS